MTAALTVSVIIPVWNDAERLQTCLDALQRQSFPSGRFEIIVADNGSTDNSADVARSYENVRVVSEPAPGSYAARNAGLAGARGVYVAFTDSDCIPDRDWLSNLVRAAAHAGEFGIIAGHVEFFKLDGACDACFTFERHFLMRQKANAANGRCVTANWLSRRDILCRFGGFDAKLVSGGDYELSARISKAGMPVIFAHDAVVMHPARSHARDLISKTRRITGGRWAYTNSRFRSLHVAALYSALCAWRIVTTMRVSMPNFSVRMGVLRLLILTWLVSLDELRRLQFGQPMRRS